MMDIVETIFTNLVYSGLGFLIGYFIGREAKFLEEVHEHFSEHPDNEETPVYHPLVTKRRTGLILISVALFAILQTAYFTYEQRRTVECLAHYNHEFSRIQDVRYEWVEEDRRALHEFLLKVSQEEDSGQALAELTRVYEENSQERRETPLPNLEQCD